MLAILKMVLQVLYYSLNVFLILYGIYYFFTGLFAFKRVKKIHHYKAKHKIAVIIPARNEEKVIGNLIDSLKQQKYPKELFDIFVIPNNCTDNTKQIALDRGALIIDCDVVTKTKGDVLKFAFKYLNTSYEDYSAYCVFDADNVVHSDFLSRMNDALCEGYKVAQGFRDSKNPSRTWISSCYSLYYLTQNYFFNKARMNMSWSASINGTGFMVAKEILEEYGFNTVTVTEDIEFAALCALNNVRIAFVDDAITYDEQPLKFGESWKQRKRWSMGTLQCLNKYSTRLFKTGVKSKIPQCIDMSLFFVAPVAQIMSLLLLAAFILLQLMSIRVTRGLLLVFSNSIVFLIISYTICVVLTLIVVKLQNKSVKKSLKGIFSLAFFMLTWIPINVLCLYTKDIEWEQIEHREAVKIEEML